MNKEYKDINDLIQSSLYSPKLLNSQYFFKEFADIMKIGYFTKEQFIKMCIWKSPRPKNQYLENTAETILRVSKEVLSSESDEEKIKLLITLKGVSIPVASAILTIIDPKNYGVMDIRVWQTLYAYGELKNKPRGQNFNLEDFKNYLTIIRKYASKLNLNVRDVEIIIFFYHRSVQEGNLYIM